jgi:MYXO-CTERM domain-containing protein
MIAQRPLSGYLAALLAAGTVTFVSSHARAACTSDAECGKGFACQVVGDSTCAGPPPCAPNIQCPPPPDCNPVQIKDCVPAPCNVDTDCGDGMVCYTSESKECTVSVAPSCPAGATCVVPPPTDPVCTVTTQSLCVPRYLLPCTTASDCGAGFNCVPTPDSCACGSSGGTAPTPAPSSSGTDPSAPAPAPTPATTAPAPSPSPDCTCTPSTTNRCEPQVTDCTANAQCPTGWTCQVVGTSGGGACGAPLLPDGGVGQVVCEPAPPVTTTMQCVPPYYNIVGQYYNDSSGGLLPPQTSSSSGAAGSSNETAGTPTGAPKSSSGSASSGDNGSCQIGNGRSSAGTALMALFGLIGLARRRRPRA